MKRNPLRKQEQRVVRAALAWFRSDAYVRTGFPSGLRLITARDAWNCPPPYTRLATACWKLDAALAKMKKERK